MRKQTDLWKRFVSTVLSVTIALAFVPFFGMQGNAVYAEDDDGIRYDSRSLGYVTPVKNQNLLGTCWAFATISAIESSLLAHGQADSAESLDLSERQLAYFSYNLVPDLLGGTAEDQNIPISPGNDNYLENYGNAWLTTEVMASGIGVVNETDAPTYQNLVNEWNEAGGWSDDFDNATKLDPELARGANSWSLSGVRRIPMEKTDDVKQAIKEDGGVAVLTYLKKEGADYWDQKISWNDEYKAFFNYGVGDSNHMVTIVGWDDNYDRHKFSHSSVFATKDIPDKNGAWLCKNSRGTDFGDEGYYWVSYEDFYFNKTDPEDLEKDRVAAYAFEMRPAAQSEILYQYDGTAGTCYKTIASGGSIANMYTVNGTEGKDEQLKSVCLTLLNDSEVDYSIQIYTDCTDEEDPTSGKAALSTPQTGRTSYAGFYTVDLDEEVLLKAGSKFAVVATLSHDEGQNVNYDVDSSGTYYNMLRHESSVSAGQSFEKDSGDAGWSDLSEAKCECDLSKDDGHADNQYSQCAARLKAVSEPVESVKPQNVKVNAPAGKILTYNGKVQIGVAAGSGYTLTGTTKATNAGKYTAKATLKTDADYDYSWADGMTDPKTVSWQIKKAANPLKVKGRSVKIKASAVKNKTLTLAVTKVMAFTGKGQGRVSYTKASGNTKIIINKTTGKVTLKKGLKKGRYVVKVKVKASGNKNYNASSVKTIVITIIVK